MIYSFPKEFRLPNGWKLRVSNPKDSDYLAEVINPWGESILDGRIEDTYADFEEFERAMNSSALKQAKEG